MVPKDENSDLSPAHINNMEDADSYVLENSEMMGAPCKWLERDPMTTEATCKVHTKKSSMCIDYPEHLVGSEYCPSGAAYWKGRKSEGHEIPAWVDGVLSKI